MEARGSELDSSIDKVMRTIYTACDADNRDLVVVSKLIEYITPFMQANLSDLMELKETLDPKNENGEISSKEFFKAMSDWTNKFNDECPECLDKESFRTSPRSLGIPDDNLLPYVQSTPRASFGNRLLRGCMEGILNMSVASNQSFIDNGQTPLADKSYLEDQIRELVHRNKQYSNELFQVKMQLTIAEENSEVLQLDLAKLKKQLENEREEKESLQAEHKDIEDYRELATNAQKQVEKVKKDLAAIEKECSGLKQQMTILEGQKQKCEERIANMHKKMKENIETIIELQTEIEVKDTDLGSLEEMKMAFMEEVSEQKKLIDDYREANEFLLVEKEKLQRVLREKLKVHRMSLPSYRSESFSEYGGAKPKPTPKPRCTSENSDSESPFTPSIKTDVFNFYNFDSPYARVKKRPTRCLRGLPTIISPLATSDSTFKQPQIVPSSPKSKTDHTHIVELNIMLTPEDNKNAADTTTDTHNSGLSETPQGVSNSPPCMYVVDRSDPKKDNSFGSSIPSSPNMGGPNDFSSDEDFSMRLQIDQTNDASPHESLQAEMSQVMQDTSYSIEALQEIEAENKRLRLKCSELESKNDNYKLELQQVNAEQSRKDAALRSQLKTTNEELAHTKKVLSDNSETIEKHISRIDELKGDIAKMENQAARLRTDHKHSKVALVNKIVRLEAKICACENDKEELKAENSALIADVARIKNENEEAIEDLRRKVDKCMADRCDIESQCNKYITEADAKMYACQNNLQLLEELSSISSANMLQLQENGGSLRGKFSAIMARKGAAVDRIESASKRLLELVSSVPDAMEFSCRICSLRTSDSENSDNCEELAHLRETLESCELENEELRGKLAADKRRSTHNRMGMKIEKLQAKYEEVEAQLRMGRARSGVLEDEKRAIQRDCEALQTEKELALAKLGEVEVQLLSCKLSISMADSTSEQICSCRMQLHRSLMQFAKKWRNYSKEVTAIDKILDEIDEGDSAELVLAFDHPLDKELHLLKSHVQLNVAVLDKLAETLPADFSEPEANQPEPSHLNARRTSKFTLKQPTLLTQPISPDSPNLEFPLRTIKKPKSANDESCGKVWNLDNGGVDAISSSYAGAGDVRNGSFSSESQSMSFEEDRTAFSDCLDTSTSFYEDAGHGVWPLPLINFEHTSEDRNKNMTEEEMEESFIAFVLQFTIDSSSMKKRFENLYLEMNKYESNLSMGVQKVLRLLKKSMAGEPMRQAECLFQSLISTTRHLSRLAEQFGALKHENTLVVPINTMINYTSSIKKKYESGNQKSCRCTSLVLRRATVEAHVQNTNLVVSRSLVRTWMDDLFGIIPPRSSITAFMVAGVIFCFAFVLLQAYSVVQVVRYEIGGGPFTGPSWEDVLNPYLKKEYRNGPPPI